MREIYPRLYKTSADSHLKSYRQMVFLSGPRQVGKTTIGESLGDLYLSWDDYDDNPFRQTRGERPVAALNALLRCDGVQ